MKISENELIEALRQYGKSQARRPAGQGWMTLAEIAARENISRHAARYRILIAGRRGLKIETAPGSALDENGMAKRVTYYRVQNGKPT